VDCFSESWGRVRERYWLLLGVSLVGALLGSALPMGILLGPMMCGIYTCYIDQWQGRPVRFERLFVGFESGLLMESIVATVVMVVLSMVVVLPLIVVLLAFGVFAVLTSVSHRGSAAPIALFAGFILGLFVVMVVAMSIGMFFVFTYPLIVDRRLSGLEALKLSARATWANFRGLLGLALLNFALSMAGLICCYVGAILVMPVGLGAIIVAYGKVFGLAENKPGVDEV
jgi:hypothetical protein